MCEMRLVMRPLTWCQRTKEENRHVKHVTVARLHSGVRGEEAHSHTQTTVPGPCEFYHWIFVILGQFPFSFLVNLHISYYKLYFIIYYQEKWGKGAQIFSSFLSPASGRCKHSTRWLCVPQCAGVCLPGRHTS